MTRSCQRVRMHLSALTVLSYSSYSTLFLVGSLFGADFRAVHSWNRKKSRLVTVKQLYQASWSSTLQLDRALTPMQTPALWSFGKTIIAACKRSSEGARRSLSFAEIAQYSLSMDLIHPGCLPDPQSTIVEEYGMLRIRNSALQSVQR